MKTTFSYNKFIKYVHDKFSDTLSEEEIETLFQLSESYNKDDPKSQGKILSINKLFFSGVKLGNIPFSYKREFQKGINIWIADNFKGKSTVFKIIKFCLTGNNTIKGAIKDWFKDIFLEFDLSGAIYTVHIDASAYHISCALYQFNIDEYQRLEKENKLALNNPNEIFKVRGEKNFSEKMEEFFFKEFAYYNLQFKTRPSNKNESVKGNVSWATYFKSIYLESSNYEYLYFNEENIGKQGTKILEMLLGLKLTYPINQLTLLRDLKAEKIRNAQFVLEKTAKGKTDDLDKLTTELEGIERKLEESNKLNDFQSLENILNEYRELETSITKNKTERNNLQTVYDLADKKLNDLESEIKQFSDDIRGREGEVTKIGKDVLQKELFVDTDSFFTNLEVHECPHCEHPVSTAKKAEEISLHKCSLCGTSVTTKKSDDELQKEQIAKLKEEKAEVVKNIELVKKQLEEKRSHLSSTKTEYNKSLDNLQKHPTTSEQEQRLNQLGDLLRQQTEEQRKYQEAIRKKDDYLQSKAVLQYRITELRKQEEIMQPDESIKLEKEIEVLSYGIQGLVQKRKLLNDETLQMFQTLILAQIQEFGTSTITEVKIDEKYDLILVQHGKEEKFEELVEGEKLRVKLAFYLAIIQLDIDHQLGRHPRFLIFDAPGSEEMIPLHLQGLVDNLKSINLKFQDNLQIFIGSAVRDFTDITEPSKSEIKQQGEFLF
jgi:hypothetical protein